MDALAHFVVEKMSASIVCPFLAPKPFLQSPFLEKTDVSSHAPAPPFRHNPLRLPNLAVLK
jgi:hypothetical protein